MHDYINFLSNEMDEAPMFFDYLFGIDEYHNYPPLEIY